MTGKTKPELTRQGHYKLSKAEAAAVARIFHAAEKRLAARTEGNDHGEDQTGRNTDR